MAELRQVSDRLAETSRAMHDAIDSFLRVVASDVTGDIERQRRAA